MDTPADRAPWKLLFIFPEFDIIPAVRAPVHAPARLLPLGQICQPFLDAELLIKSYTLKVGMAN
jgi:hypothetical protein